MLITIMKALSDRHRLYILASCSQDECHVADITASCTLSQATVSAHLKVLKDAGLLVYHAHKTLNAYYINPELDPDLLTLVKTILSYVYRDPQWQIFHERLLRLKEIRRMKDDYEKKLTIT